MTLISLLSLGAGAIGVATLATFALPRHVEVTRQAEMAVPPGDVLALASSEGELPPEHVRLWLSGLATLRTARWGQLISLVGSPGHEALRRRPFHEYLGHMARHLGMDFCPCHYQRRGARPVMDRADMDHRVHAMSATLSGILAEGSLAGAGV